MSQIICLENKIITNKRTITPKKFLEWAKLDLKEKDQRACGNALGNIKKAIHCRIDEIIYKTNITYSKNWGKHINTGQKLEIIKEIGVKYRNVIQFITEKRNKFEHDYRVIDIDQILSYYDMAELWLEKTYQSYSFDRIGIILKSDKNIIDTDFNILDKCNFEYYWYHKKEIHDYKNGELTVYSYSGLEWEDLLRYQKRYITNLMENGSLYTLSQAKLTMIYKRLRKFNNIT